MKDFLIKNKVPIIVLLLIAEGLFLRTYHLTDWLHFQLDQARDAFLIKDIIEKGAGELPLLGPRAGGSFLRLGPAYYYLMYLLATVARSTHPVVFVLPEILGSIAFVPMFYLLARRLFNQNWSLILTALAVNSTFLVTYDRFSWNPNLMPLFSVIAIYAWLKYLAAKREEDHRKSLKWIALTALAVGIFIQLHFEAFIALPIIFAISIAIFWSWLYKFKGSSIKKLTLSMICDLGIFIIVILITHIPVILNEYFSQGANTKEFFATISEKQDKDELHSLTEKLIQNLTVYPKGFYNVITGGQGVHFPTVLTRPNLNLLCDYGCHNNYAKTAVAALFFLVIGTFFLLYLFKKTKKILFLKKNPVTQKARKFEFLILLLFWVIVPWWAFYSISFNLRPRFFLFTVAPFWLIAGLFLREVSRHRWGKNLALALVATLFISNLANLYFRFSDLANAEREDKGSYPEDQIFYQNGRYPVTLNQQSQVSRWISGKYQQEKENKDYLFLWAPSYFYRPLLYLLNENEFKDKLRYFSNYPSWQNAGYFAVTRTADPTDFFNAERNELFNIQDEKSFGTLTVYQLELTEKGTEAAREREKKFRRGEVLTDPEKVKRDCLKKPKPACRFNWEDLFAL